MASDRDPQLPARLRDARQRLERAVDAVEAAVEQRLTADAAEATVARQASEAAARRLDGAIARLRALLKD